MRGDGKLYRTLRVNSLPPVVPKSWPVEFKKPLRGCILAIQYVTVSDGASLCPWYFFFGGINSAIVGRYYDLVH